MTARRPITDKVPNLRQRRRANGSWRVWWEPSGTARAAGFTPMELDADRATWSVRQARQMNEDVTRHLRGGDARAPSASGGRTISALIHEYKQSRKYLARSAATRRGYTTNLNAIDAKWGNRPVQEFSKPILHTWYETLYRTAGPTQALNMIRSFSILFSYAEVLGWRAENSNPCFRLGMESQRPRDRAATWAEFDALIRAADDLGHHAMACGIILATLQGQRQKDVIQARLDAFSQIGGLWVWQLVRSKKENYGAMPLHDETRARVLSLIDAARDDQEFLLVDELTGRDYASEAVSGDLFRKRWAAIRSHAAEDQPSVRSLQFRDLRRTFGVWARAGGALREDVGDVLGNSAAIDPQLGETYMPPSFHTAARAVQAVQRPNPERKKA